MDVIGNELSQYCFDGLPIEVSEIKKVDGKEIAVINLKESVFNEEIDAPKKFVGRTWKAGYFQGSCGGSITSMELIETFLQRDYKGKWIDGVQFLYEGNNITEFDHVPRLSDINYR